MSEPPADPSAAGPLEDGGLTSAGLNSDERQSLLAGLFGAHRDRLRRMVDIRLDPRLHARIDSSDVLQEAYLVASERLEEYVERPPMPAFLWLRFLVGQKIHDLHRHHLGAQARDVRKEVPIAALKPPEASTIGMAALFVDKGQSPSQAAMQAESHRRVIEALEAMDADEREVLALRHFEGLSNREAARTLGLEESAASKRYIRALERLKKTLSRGAGEG